MKLGIKLCHEKAKLPKFETSGAACFDLVATTREVAGKTALYGTGLKFEIPEGYHIKVYSRSGDGFKRGLRLANVVGIVDADYKGEVMVKLTYDGPDYAKPEWPFIGERIAQAMLVRNVKTEIVEIEELSESERGEKGFGSTGR